MDLVKDHLIPHIVGKNTSKEMYDALETFYQSVNVSKMLFFKNKLTMTLCTIDIVASHQMKLAKLKD